MRNTGIWLDKDKANIVTIENGVETFDTVSSNIEHYNIRGGSGTRQKGGPQDVIQDRKYLEREKQQMKLFFKTIATQIKGSDALVIFGPGNTYEKFGKELHESYNTLGTKIKGIKKADSMTDNQVKALVRDFFNEDK